MKQATLPLWQSSNHVTYTELKEMLEQLYEERGPQLVKRAFELIEALDECFSLSLFSDLNELVLELSALSPSGWAEFSTMIFARNLLCQNGLYTQRPMANVRDTFMTTVKGLAHE